jgi:prepilin-type processing-associated H-X9-DG protein
LLVVIAIIAILIGLLLPAIQRVRESSSRIACNNNLKQLALACVNYENSNHNIPPGDAPSSSQHFVNGDDGASWMFLVLPYMEQDILYQEARSTGSLANAQSKGIVPVKLSFTRCPSDSWMLTIGLYCNYVGSSGPQCNFTPTGNCDTPIFAKYCNGAPENQSYLSTSGVPPVLQTYPGYAPSYTWGDTNLTGLVRGMFVRGGAIIRFADVTDGSSNTILVGETLPEFCEFQRYTTNGWAGSNHVSQGQTIQPINWPIDPIGYPGPPNYSANCAQSWNGQPTCPSGPTHCMWNWHVTWGFKSRHPGGVNFAFGDGSVHWVNETIDHQLYQYLGCRHDGQPVSIP